MQHKCQQCPYRACQYVRCFIACHGRERPVLQPRPEGNAMLRMQFSDEIRRIDRLLGNYFWNMW